MLLYCGCRNYIKRNKSLTLSGLVELTRKNHSEVHRPRGTTIGNANSSAEKQAKLFFFIHREKLAPEFIDRYNKGELEKEVNPEAHHAEIILKTRKAGLARR